MAWRDAFISALEEPSIPAYYPKEEKDEDAEMNVLSTKEVLCSKPRISSASWRYAKQRRILISTGLKDFSGIIAHTTYNISAAKIEGIFKYATGVLAAGCASALLTSFICASYAIRRRLLSQSEIEDSY